MKQTILTMSLLVMILTTTSQAESAVTRVTVAYPNDVQPGSLLIAVVTTEGDTSSTLTALDFSWTRLTIGHTDDQVTLALWAKKANGTETGPTRFAWAGQHQAATTIIALEDVDLCGISLAPTCDMNDANLTWERPQDNQVHIHSQFGAECSLMVNLTPSL